MMTGLLGITSGLDGLAAQIKRRGLPVTMTGPGGWESLAQSAIQGYRSGRQRSIVIVGYSAGGASALEMARVLHKASVPVQLVVLFDSASGPPVSANVRRLVNFHVKGGYGAAVARPKSFAGSLENVAPKDSNVGHFSIIGAYERRALGLVMAAAGRAPAATTRTAAPDSKAASPRETTGSASEKPAAAAQ